MKFLISSLAVASLATLAGNASAAPAAYGDVISSTPIVVQTSMPRQLCRDEPGYVQAPPSGGGAIVGGILGGLVGNAVGAGAGRALATGVGAIAGAVVGNGIEASNAPVVPATTTNCIYSRAQESRVVGYDVVYEFNGQRYATRTQRDPGAQIALDVRPSGGSPYDAPTDGSVTQGYVVPGYPAAAYPPVDAAPYPPPAPPYAAGYYAYPAVPVYFDARFGGGHYRHGR